MIARALGLLNQGSVMGQRGTQPDCYRAFGQRWQSHGNSYLSTKIVNKLRSICMDKNTKFTPLKIVII